MFVGLDVHDEDQGVVVLNLLHGTLSGVGVLQKQSMNNELSGPLRLSDISVKALSECEQLKGLSTLKTSVIGSGVYHHFGSGGPRRCREEEARQLKTGQAFFGGKFKRFWLILELCKTSG